MSRVVLPVDRLSELWPDALRGARVGAVLHSASVASDLTPTLAILEAMQAEGRLRLEALFGPQHGFASTTQDNMIEWSGYPHPRLGVTVNSLYGEHRKPTAGMLENLDAMFLDLVDVGARYYTFIWTMLLCLEAASEKGIPLVVADRPNPINGVTIEGRPQREDHLSFVGLHPLPIRHGRTIGELARQFRDERFPGADLVVLPFEGWRRDWFHDEAGLPWVMPSPNMPTLDTAIVYPGMCLFEGTNVSEGRGTTRPFELFGAPWIDGHELSRDLNVSGLPGVRFREVSFDPGFQKHAGETCHGCQLHVTDRDSFEPVRTALLVLRNLRERYLENFSWKEPPYEYEYDKLPIEILCGRPENEIFSETI